MKFYRALSVLVLALQAVLINTPTQAEEIYIATSRAELSGPSAADIAPQYYLSYDMKALADRQPGQYIDQFVTTARRRIPTLNAFAREVISSSRERFGTGEVLVVVHGYNTTFWTSQMRATQLAVDLDIPAATVQFSWPNAHNLLAYGEDLGRAAQAQLALETLLVGLTRAGASRVVVIGHSMGADLVMETLAKMRRHGNGQFFARFGGAALLSPDMPMVEFKTTMRAIRAPVVIYSSSTDWVLDLVARMSDQQVRVGAVHDASAFGGLPLIVVDTANATHGGMVAHYAVGGQPGLLAMINAMAKPDLIGFAQALVRNSKDLQRSGETVVVRLSAGR